jgi:YegS/Rv2252/BmrU family lipid kinase
VHVVADAIARGARRFVAVGGDGTLHEVVNGVLGSRMRCTLAVVPNGTGNDWARGQALPRTPAGLADLLACGRSRALDAGEIEYSTPSGTERRWFVNVAGCGYDAHVLERLSARAPRGLAYLLAVAGGLATYAPARFRVRADGATAIDATLFVAFAALGRYCGGGMQVAPGADPADGALDVVGIRHLGLPSTLARLPRLYTGGILRDPAVRHFRTALVEIDADPPVRVEADGQLLGHTPARMRVLPQALDCVVP